MGPSSRPDGLPLRGLATGASYSRLEEAPCEARGHAASRHAANSRFTRRMNVANNPDDAQLTSVFVRDSGSPVATEAIDLDGGGVFEVVVQGQAGTTRANSNQPYTVSITA